MTKVNICYGTCDETTYEVDYVIVEALDHTEDQFRPRRLWIQGSKEQVKEMLTKAWDKYLIYIEANGESWATMGSYHIKEHPEGIWNFKVTVIPTVTIPLY